MVSITEKEIKESVELLLKEIEDFPEVNIENLFQIGSIFLTIGNCLESPSFKLLADYLFAIPSRLKPLLLYQYQLAGAVGELKDKYSKLIENAKEQISKIIHNCLKVLLVPNIDEREVLKHVEQARKLFNSLPRFETES
jgi:hypothetical protein